ncbi:tetratricopeptide repeat protein [Acaryochloris sp. 'Moss Beach']|uniref:tetratricopeptide repeat protein n=1 Tax=Acaryochloris sp. 'Moss Beach' TaxID=2740837 RepID=UPI001F2AEBAF|nr:tetratricopeptide repeat protein [Acaryochloris sp. 'Moss Beach']UJB68984.1 tetratricopeptide repeat protein [Acaryochloris sp. 'Moss Beach']
MPKKTTGKKASKYLKKAVQLKPDEVWMRANLAWALSELGLLQEAEAMNTQALIIEPTNIFAMGVQAWINSQSKQWKTVIRYAKPAIFKTKQSAPDHIRAHQQWIYPLLIVALNNVVTSKSRNNEVDRFIQDFITQNPNSAQAWSLKGWRDFCNNIDSAKVDFERAYHLDDTPNWAIANLGIAYERIGDLTLAILAYKALVQLEPGNDFAYLRLGTVYAQKSNWQLAWNFLSQAIQLNPDSAIAHHNLAWVSLRLPKIKTNKNSQDIISLYKKSSFFI